MALSKSITSPEGIAVTYWVVRVGHIDMKAGKVVLTVDGYKDQPSYAGGMSPFASVGKDYTLPVNPADALPLPNGTLVQNVSAWMDAKVLAQSDFSGGSIVA